MSMRMTVAALAAAIIATCIVPTQVGATENPTMTEMPKPAKSGHAAINGVNYYYEVHGQGEPLLLLHGGLGQIEMFGPVLAALAKRREVIGVDLHGHGRTELGNREISLIDMGDDLARVLKKLGYKQVDVLGYSMGGGAAFRLAVQHPQLVRRLVIVSSGMSQDSSTPRCCRSRPRWARP